MWKEPEALLLGRGVGDQDHTHSVGARGGQFIADADGTSSPRRKGEPVSLKRIFTEHKALSSLTTSILGVFEHLRHGVCVFDERGRLAYANPQASRIYRLSEPLEVGIGPEEVCRRWVDAGLTIAGGEDYLEGVLSLRRSRQPTTRMLSMRDGHRVSVTLRPVEQGGWISIHEDWVQASPIVVEQRPGAEPSGYLLSQLSAALDEGQFDLEYQPIVDVASGRIVYAEALLRWDHPRLGRLLPETFLSVADQAGRMKPITRWVIEETCRELASSRGSVPLWVNVCARQFAEMDIPSMVASALESGTVPGNRLGIEITEAHSLQATEATLWSFRALRQMGVKIAMDDFGQGYSSLATLQLFPFDTVKIGRSFIVAAKYEDRTMRLLKAMVEMAHTLDAQTVVEGVETHEQFAMAREVGSDLAQGFLFGRPMRAADLRRRADGEILNPRSARRAS